MELSLNLVAGKRKRSVECIWRRRNRSGCFKLRPTGLDRVRETDVTGLFPKSSFDVLPSPLACPCADEETYICAALKIVELGLCSTQDRLRSSARISSSPTSGWRECRGTVTGLVARDACTRIQKRKRGGKDFKLQPPRKPKAKWQKLPAKAVLQKLTPICFFYGGEVSESQPGDSEGWNFNFKPFKMAKV